jgi:hypothetical protein
LFCTSFGPRAVKRAPKNAPYAEQLQAYQALAGRLPPRADSAAAATAEPSEVSSPDPGNEWQQMLAVSDRFPEEWDGFRRTGGL